MKISTNIILPNIVLAACVIGVMSYQAFQIHITSEELDRDVHEITLANNHVLDLNILHKRMEENLLEYGLTDDPKYLSAVQDADVKITKAIDELTAQITTARGKQLLNQYIMANNGVRSIQMRLIEDFDNNAEARIEKDLSRLARQEHLLDKTLKELTIHTRDLMENTIRRTVSLNDEFRIALLGTSLLALLLCLLTLVYTRLTIVRPIKAMQQAIDDMRLGKKQVLLDQTITQSEGELGELASAFNQMHQDLSQTTVSLDQLTREIEQRKIAEQELIDNMKRMEVLGQRAEAASLAKTNFLATMSHEIRTPLNGVLGMARLLAQSSLDPEQRTRLDTILDSGETLLTIINDILDMSKIESGSMDLEEVPFSLNHLIETTLSPFRELATKNDLHLDIETPRKEVDGLNGDPTRLRQILTNLVGNAIKFTHEGSIKVTIKDLPDTHPDAPRLGARNLQVTVADTGIGIAPERLDNIFERFTQEDETTTRRYGGSGLGLAIVRKIVEIMGGKILVHSEVGVGTRFDVFLPFQEVDSDQMASLMKSKDDISNLRVRSLKILVAEDNMVNAMIAKAFLEGLGHQVSLVGNGKLAVEAIARNEAELLFTDIHMPVMDGVEATQQIRKTNPHIPIIGLTAEAFVDRHMEFLKAGMNDVLTKPYTADQMKQAIIKSVPASLCTAAAPSMPPIQEIPKKKIKKPLQGCRAKPIVAVGDDEKFQELVETLGADFTCQTTEEALRAIPDLLSQLHENVSGGNCDKIRELAHSVKGGAGSMMAPKLSRQAAIIQDKAEDLDYVRSAMDELDKTADETVAWWREKLTSLNNVGDDNAQNA